MKLNWSIGWNWILSHSWSLSQILIRSWSHVESHWMWIFSALPHCQMTLKIKSVPCWWSIDRIFVWSKHLIGSHHVSNTTKLVSFDDSHYYRTIWWQLFDNVYNQDCGFPLGLGGQGGPKMHVETNLFQSSLNVSFEHNNKPSISWWLSLFCGNIQFNSLSVIFIASFEHNPGDCHHCCLQCDGLLPGCLVWLACLMLRSSLPCWVGEGSHIWEQLPVSKFCNGFSWAVCILCNLWGAFGPSYGIPALWSHQFRGHFIHHHGCFRVGECWDRISGVWGFCVQSMIRSVTFGKQVYTIFELRPRFETTISLGLTYQSCLSMTLKVVCLFLMIIWCYNQDPMTVMTPWPRFREFLAEWLYLEL